jgi:hypothetical protein
MEKAADDLKQAVDKAMDKFRYRICREGVEACREIDWSSPAAMPRPFGGRHRRQDKRLAHVRAWTGLFLLL